MDEASLSDVIRGAQRGESAAFDRLVDAFGHRINGFLYRLTGSRHEAEDLVQEVFVRLVRTIGTYHHDGRFEPWLFRIAANLARDRVRRVQRSPKIASVGGVGDGEDDSRSLDTIEGDCEAAGASLERGEAIDALNAALERLPSAEREVVLLRHFSQMSFKEIAEATGTPLGTALARGHRGLARLRDMMTASTDAEVPPAARNPVGNVEGVNRDV